jgi:hypothetical protein
VKRAGQLNREEGKLMTSEERRTAEQRRRKHDAQVAGETLQDEEEKKWAGLMKGRAQLQHLVEKLGGLPSTQGLHGVDLLNTLELREVVITQPLFDGLVRILIWRIGHQSRMVCRHSLGRALKTRSSFTCLSSMFCRRNRDSAMPNHASEFSAQN